MKSARSRPPLGPTKPVVRAALHMVQGAQVYEPQTAATYPSQSEALDALACHVVPSALLDVNRAHDREPTFDERSTTYRSPRRSQGSNACERTRDEDERDQVREQRVADVRVQGVQREAGDGAQARAPKYGADDAELRAELLADGLGIFCFNGGGFLVTEGRGADAGAASCGRSAR